MVPQNLRFFFVGALLLASSCLFNSSRLRSALSFSVSGAASGPGGRAGRSAVGDSFLGARPATSESASKVDGGRTPFGEGVAGSAGAGGVSARRAALALLLPPIIPSFVGRLAFGDG